MNIYKIDLGHIIQEFIEFDIVGMDACLTYFII